MNIATKQELEQIIDQRTRKLEDKVLREIQKLGETKYITLQEVADELHRTKETASKWLERHEQIHVIREGRGYLINREDFYQTLRNKI